MLLKSSFIFSPLYYRVIVSQYNSLKKSNPKPEQNKSTGA